MKKCIACGRRCEPTRGGYCEPCAEYLRSRQSNLPVLTVAGSHVLCTVERDGAEYDMLFSYGPDVELLDAVNRTLDRISGCQLGELLELEGYREY